MARRRLRGLLLALTVLVSAACGGGPSSPTAKPAATSWQEFTVAYCAAWDALFRAVGNPDTASGSDLSRSLDEAVKAGDVPTADGLAAEMTRELTAGREQVAVAAGYARRAAMMVEFDRLFAAYEAHTEAKRAAARREPNSVEPQAAFEQAGGLSAWVAMFEAARGVERTPAEPEHRCANVPVGV
jgi:hypothetical protein